VNYKPCHFVDYFVNCNCLSIFFSAVLILELKVHIYGIKLSKYVLVSYPIVATFDKSFGPLLGSGEFCMSDPSIFERGGCCEKFEF